MYIAKKVKLKCMRHLFIIRGVHFFRRDLGLTIIHKKKTTQHVWAINYKLHIDQ